MKPAHIDFEVNKGSTFVRTVQWKTGDPIAAVDLTNCTARMQIRKTVNDTNILDDLTTENTRLSIDTPLDGKIKITIPADVSSEYSFTGAVYDLEIVFTDNTVTRLIEGRILAIPEVTR